jgi:chaperonin cofactor prefoldin
MSQVEGQITTMRGDAQSNVFQNVGNMFSQLIQEKEKAEKLLAEANTTLEKIYSGHPDIKITMEKDEKEKVAPKIKGK